MCIRDRYSGKKAERRLAIRPFSGRAIFEHVEQNHLALPAAGKGWWTGVCRFPNEGDIMDERVKLLKSGAETPLGPPQALGDVPKMRACLRCHTKFESSGFGDRICRRCKGSNVWRHGIATTYGSKR